MSIHSASPQNKSVLMPATPLTGRSYLKSAESAPVHPAATPITASMYSVSRLQALLEGRGPRPSPQLAAVLGYGGTEAVCVCVGGGEGHGRAHS